MRATAEEFVSTCIDELAAGKAARERLMRTGLPHHASDTCDYFVCPHCGLVYDIELPEVCVVDQTPGEAFITIR